MVSPQVRAVPHRCDDERPVRMTASGRGVGTDDRRQSVLSSPSKATRPGAIACDRTKTGHQRTDGSAIHRATRVSYPRGSAGDLRTRADPPYRVVVGWCRVGDGRRVRRPGGGWSRSRRRVRRRRPRRLRSGPLRQPRRRCVSGRPRRRSARRARVLLHRRRGATVARSRVVGAGHPAGPAGGPGIHGVVVPQRVRGDAPGPAAAGPSGDDRRGGHRRHRRAVARRVAPRQRHDHPRGGRDQRRMGPRLAPGRRRHRLPRLPRRNGGGLRINDPAVRHRLDRRGHHRARLPAPRRAGRSSADA
jgi:hypothetical protein